MRCDEIPVKICTEKIGISIISKANIYRVYWLSKNIAEMGSRKCVIAYSYNSRVADSSLEYGSC